MDQKKRIQSVILLIAGALFMLIQHPLFGWGGVIFQIIGVYGLLSIYKPGMKTWLKAVIAIIAGIAFSFIIATIFSFLLY